MTDQARACTVCQTVNAAGLRYCISCGSTLEKQQGAPQAAPPPPAAYAPPPAYTPPPAPAPAYAPPPQAPPQAPYAAPPAPQPGNGPYGPGPQPFAPPPAPAPQPQPGPGLGHGAPMPPPPAPIAPSKVVDLGATTLDPMRPCARCRGMCEPTAQFCKYCGAQLGRGSTPDVAAEAQRASPAPQPVAQAPQPVAPGPQPIAHAPQPQPIAHAPQPQPIAHAPQPIAPPQPQPAAPPQPAPQAAPAPPPPAPAPMAPQPSAAPRPPQAPHVAPAGARGTSAMPARASSPPPGQPARAVPPTAIDPPLEAAPRPPAPAASAAPRPPAQAARVRGRVVVIAKSGADGPSYPLADTLDIGRVEGQLIVAEDPYLSPRHVRLVFQGDQLFLRDLGSTNGVFLRLTPQDAGKRRGSSVPALSGLKDGESGVVLEDHDVVLVGQQVLRVELLSEVEPRDPLSEHGTLVFGTPASPRYARLCQRSVEGMTRDVYYVRKAETVLGRESGDVVFTEDPFLSRRHAAVRVVAEDGAPIANGGRPGARARVALVDLGSSNGSFVRVRADVPLRGGDQFRVGQQLFRVDLDADRAG